MPTSGKGKGGSLASARCTKPEPMMPIICLIVHAKARNGGSLQRVAQACIGLKLMVMGRRALFAAQVVARRWLRRSEPRRAIFPTTPCLSRRGRGEVENAGRGPDILHPGLLLRVCRLRLSRRGWSRWAHEAREPENDQVELGGGVQGGAARVPTHAFTLPPTL